MEAGRLGSFFRAHPVEVALVLASIFHFRGALGRPDSIHVLYSATAAVLRRGACRAIRTHRPWSDADALFDAVNSVEYGLTCSIWTRDLETALQAAGRVEAGYVWINGSSAHFVGAPFGGYKQSGVGREGCLEELLDYTQLKNVNVTLDG